MDKRSMLSYKNELVISWAKNGVVTKIIFLLLRKINPFSTNCHHVARPKSTPNFFSGSSCGNSDACSTLEIPRKLLAPFLSLTKSAKKTSKKWQDGKEGYRAFRLDSLSIDMTMKCIASLWKRSWIRWRSANLGSITWSQTRWRSASRYFSSSKADMT